MGETGKDASTHLDFDIGLPSGAMDSTAVILTMPVAARYCFLLETGVEFFGRMTRIGLPRPAAAT